MSAKVAMYDKAFASIGPRLAALNLDIDIVTFDKDGLFQVKGRNVAASDVTIDYCWLSAHLVADGVRDKAFRAMLDCKSIGVLQTFNAGLDYPFYKKISDKGTRICNSSAQGIAIAEYVLAQVLAVLHPIAQQRDQQARKIWKQTAFREISETHWLIVGYGPIAQELAKRLRAFGAKISVIRRSPDATALADRAGTMAELSGFLPDADVVVLACANNAETRGMANEAFFAAMRPGAILVNIARGALVDDAAMLGALDRGQLATTILDVFNEEPLPVDNALWSHPKVRLTAHTSFFGSGVRARWEELFLDNIGRYCRGETLVGEVRPQDIG